MTLLMGWSLFTWSVFPGLSSLALCLAYPSSFALGASFHLWALLRKALARGWKLPAYLGLGVLLALVMLGARPFPSLTVWLRAAVAAALRSEEHTSELQSQSNLVCRLLLEKKKKQH